ncbi:hypothetical protein SD71_02335 [Cohnella kolymensis]|uniref:MurNAc-LAA domain-containing protein n=1 Tax=Cohnella kolymensis TaxID=1590652 RepID=A0ABR5A926_9BACL|nr:N-acetylmuramoyl-L-alanine amidase [Cohnella kolymensis]KIL37491.1 hypothetical protein SD71_02335 [Cohnella kolymensis]
MKNWVTFLFVFVFMLCLTAGITYGQSPTPSIVLNGKVLTLKEPPGFIGKHMMLPVRAVGESLGYIVSYDNKTERVSVKNGSSTIVMTLNNSTAMVNQKTFTLEAPPTIASGTTLIPLRFVSETLGLQVYWDNVSKTVFLYSAESTDNSGTVDESDTPANPVDVTARLRQVIYENGSVNLKYDGVLTPAVTTLENPDRIVVDLAAVDFADDFLPALSADPKAPRLGELPISGDPVLQKVRYSVFSDNPKTIRFVLDLNKKSEYEIHNNAETGEIQIVFDSEETPQQNTSLYTVVLDAGHGGTDPGAKSISGRWEKDFNLNVILKVQALLNQEPQLNVVLTRNGDSFPALAERVSLAESLNADLFLSVHGNSNIKSSIVGSETYYTRPESLDFAKMVHDFAVPAVGLKDRGILQKSLHVTRETTMPAVLFEAGYLSNPNEEQLMYTEDFQNQLAQGLVTAITTYLKLP